MKNRVQKTGIGSILFILLLFTAFALVQPVYRRMTETVNRISVNTRKELEDRTGLSFSYVSLSPSILSAIRMKGIVVSDAVTGAKLVTVRKLVLSYRLSFFLWNKTEPVLKDLTLSGLSIEYDAVANQAVRRKLIGFFNVVQGQKTEVSSEQILDRFPFTIHVQNAELHYRKQTTDIRFILQRASMEKNSSGQSFSVSITGRVSVVANNQHFSCGLVSKCVIPTGFSGSSARVYLSNISGNWFQTDRFDFFLNYKNDTVQIKTLRNPFPLYLEASMNMETKNIIFSAKAEKLEPLRFVTLSHPPSVVGKLSGMKTGFELSGSYGIKTGDLSYKSNGTFSLPSRFVSGGCTIMYSVSGNKKQISVPSFSITGRDYDIFYSGAYNILKQQPSGTVEIRKIVLPNGGIISTDVYFDALDKGFMCFSPQLYLDNQAFTALQLTVVPQKGSIDFSFEGYDYAHIDAEKPGSIKINGSYLTDTKYVQANINIANIYLDSILTAAAFPLKQDKTSSLHTAASLFRSYIFSGEMYVSSDFSTLSYNIPYSVIANTKKDRELLVFSLDGNSNSFQITRFNLLYGNQTLNMTALAELPSSSTETFFTTDITCNSVPYKFAGTVSNRWLDITGDYGFHAAVSFNPLPVNMLAPIFSGSVHMDDFPIAVRDSVFTLSADTTFTDTGADGFSCTVSRFEVQEPSGKLALSPKLSLTGTMNKYGFIVDSLAYTDTVSVLNGSGSFLWNINNGIFDSANVQFKADSLLSSETWVLNGSITNPDGKQLSIDNVRQNLYFSGEANFRDFPSGRFLSDQSDDNFITASFTVSGTAENPYMSLAVKKSSISILGAPLSFNGSIVLEDGVVQVSNTSMQWLMMKLSNVDAIYSLRTATGSITTNFDAKLLEQTISAPVTIKIDSIAKPENHRSPESYIVKISSDSVSGSLFPKPFSAGISIVHTPERNDIYSDGDIALSGYVLKDGEVFLGTGEGVPVQARLTGYVHKNGMSLSIDDISANLADFSRLLSYPVIAVYGGEVKGAFTITGLAADPAFNGQLTVTSPELNLPIVIPEHLLANQMILNIKNSEITMPDTEFVVHGNPVTANLILDLDRWNFNSLVIGVKAASGVYVPADIDLDGVRITGQGNPDLQITITSDHTDITGKILARNTSVNISSRFLASAASSGEIDGKNKLVPNASDYGVTASLDILMGQRVQLLLDPLLRGVVLPNTTLSLLFDSTENRLLLNSDISFRGGEIVYLNRNFYMREGRIVFSGKQDVMDPVITVRAETRERDDDGNQVTIILSAENQPFSRFSPLLSSTPAKSENEIMELLGQIVSGDSKNVGSLLLATGDYAVQVTVMRKIENALRDLCNFDIFSIRTMVLQNAMKQGLNLNSGNHTVTAGNFFDNSTVYIGKYFGSELYTDALLHWTYDETRVNDGTTAGGLVFQPEFGLEMASPFVNIRWSIAPDIDAIKNNLWIPTTSVTLSWKFTF